MIDHDAELAQAWMSETGIVLMRPCESIDELEGMWASWKSMSESDKAASDHRSIQIFGMDNESHYSILRLLV